MDFSCSEDQISLRDLARQILEERAGHDRLRELEQGSERVDRDLWSELARANLLGVPIAEEWGGSSLGIWELALLLEEAGRSVAPVPLLATLVGGALPIQEFGSADQKQRFLARVVEGDCILSVALAEPGAPEIAAPATRAKRDAGDYRLEGQKLLVPCADLAERVLVTAQVDGAGLGVFLLDPSAPGVRRIPQTATTGEPRFDLELSGATVAAADVLADPSRGAELAGWLQQRLTAGLCALQLGVTERALAMTAEYARQREQFDRPIGSFQAVHQRAADAYIDVEAIRLTLWQALHRLAEGLPADDALAVAKYWASEAGSRAAYAAQHLHGGIGVDTDYPLHRYYLWSRDLSLSLGSAAEQIAALGVRIAAGDR